MSTEFTPPVPAIAPASQLLGGTVSRRWTARYSLVWFGYWIANLVPLQLLLPQQLQDISPQSKVTDFAIVNGISGLVALIALPISGALCDRSRNRFGRRRVWLGGGVLAVAAGVVVTSMQTTVPGVTVAWSATMLGLSAATAGLTAVIADRVPERQRGMISSAIYGPQALGVVVGIALVAAFDLSPERGYLIIAALLVVCTLPFLLSYRDVAHPAEPALRLRTVVTSLGRSLKHRDFAWAFGGRILVNLANSLGTCYSLYFLIDGLKVADPETSLLLVTVVYLAAGLAATTVAGILSDRLGRRRIFVAVTAFLQAFAGFLLAAFPSMTTYFVSSALMGGGFGAYMAVDQALITQVLPDAESRAKDLGIMNIGALVPPALAPLLASLFITSGLGYPMLFTAVGIGATIGAALTYRVRSVP
jgi:MFS family permease